MLNANGNMRIDSSVLKPGMLSTHEISLIMPSALSYKKTKRKKEVREDGNEMQKSGDRRRKTYQQGIRYQN